MVIQSALEGVKILEFGRVATGPLATTMLSDYGATTVKVESAQFLDPVRHAGPYCEGRPGVNRSGYFTKWNTNKLGLGLNLLKPKAKEVFIKLVMWCDVLLESNAPGVSRKFGLHYEELVKIKPDLVMISTSQVGQKGPQSNFKAYGAQSTALGGFYDVIGYPDGEPVGPYGAYTDMVAYQQVATAIIAGLMYHKRTGKGIYFDHSQLEAGIMFLLPARLYWKANNKKMPVHGNRHPAASPHGIYRCMGEDRWCAISIFDDKQWQGFCRALSELEWTHDKKFETFLSRKQNEDALDSHIEEWTLRHSSEQVMHQLQANGVPAAIVTNGEDIANDPQLNYRRHFVQLNHQEMGWVHHEMPPHRFSKTPAQLWGSAPCLGQHNEYICKELLRLPDDEIADLLINGVLESA